jgi:hypothetical protein
VQTPAAVPEYELARHFAQVLADVAAVTADELPLAQSVQVPVPLVALYFPAMHPIQTSEAGSKYPMTCTLFKIRFVVSPLIIYRYCPCRACVHVTCTSDTPAGHAIFDTHKAFCPIWADGSIFPTLTLKVLIFKGSVL